MSFKIGENIGPYRITEQLGQGGMATVYKAYHAALDRYVALKVLHPAFNEDKTFAMRFQREARVVAKLEHPHIVPVYDYADHEGRPYLVMKYIEGDTLKARLIQGPLTSSEIRKVVDSVGSALAYAHQQGILHRDIKPSNVIIANDGVMYLADFGLARIAQAGESTLSSDSIMGTPQYISPEQAMGKKELDEGTDIYSFGVMLYEMVVGQVPFSADTPFSIIHDHIYSPLPMPRAINPKVPEPVERVLLKALAKERTDRHASIEDLMTAFKDAWIEAGVPMEGTSITMRPASLKPAPVSQRTSVVSPAPTSLLTGQPAAEKKKRSPWVYIGGALLLLVCCATGLIGARRQGLLRQLANPAINQPTLSDGSATPFAPQPVSSAQSQDATTPGVVATSAQIQAGMDAVQADPNNPDAHLQLSLAYYDAGQERSAYEELLRASELASDKKEFFKSAADSFRERQAWIAVSAMDLRLANIYRSANQPVPDHLATDFHEATYKAAEQPQMTDYVFFDRIANFDQPFSLIIQGRYALFNGSPAEAQIYLNDANKLKPDLPEGLLLQAEIYLKQSKNDEAKQILVILKADLAAADWIRHMADDYYRTLP